jgi:hypothetical protein
VVDEVVRPSGAPVRRCLKVHRGLPPTVDHHDWQLPAVSITSIKALDIGLVSHVRAVWRLYVPTTDEEGLPELPGDAGRNTRVLRCIPHASRVTRDQPDVLHWAACTPLTKQTAGGWILDGKREARR